MVAIWAIYVHMYIHVIDNFWGAYILYAAYVPSVMMLGILVEYTVVLYAVCMFSVSSIPFFVLSISPRFHSLTLNTCTYDHEAQGMDIVASDMGNFNHHRTEHDE